MSLSSQFIDPDILKAMDPELRAQVERHFAVGFKQVEAKVAEMKLDKARFQLKQAAKLQDIRTPYILPLLKR